MAPAALEMRAAQRKRSSSSSRSLRVAHTPPPLALVSVRLLMFTALEGEDKNITDILAVRGSRCLRPELGLLAGDLAITSLSAGMDIWIEWYPPEIYTDVSTSPPEVLDHRPVAVEVAMKLVPNKDKFVEVARGTGGASLAWQVLLRFDGFQQGSDIHALHQGCSAFFMGSAFAIKMHDALTNRNIRTTDR
uniref:Uncharacterized protein n=1 Tax=Aegilops tauschii TaxID=37682 RepID=R7W1G1_AEGTA